jgi:hypothetical protein
MSVCVGAGVDYAGEGSIEFATENGWWGGGNVEAYDNETLSALILSKWSMFNPRVSKILVPMFL